MIKCFIPIILLLCSCSRAGFQQAAQKKFPQCETYQMEDATDFIVRTPAGEVRYASFHGNGEIETDVQIFPANK